MQQFRVRFRIVTWLNKVEIIPMLNIILGKISDGKKLARLTLQIQNLPLSLCFSLFSQSWAFQALSVSLLSPL